MATLNALNKAPILDQDGANVVNSKHAVATSDANVVGITGDGHGYQYAVGLAAGTATVTATRLLDGATATLEVEVLAAVPFAISLGAESPA